MADLVFNILLFVNVHHIVWGCPHSSPAPSPEAAAVGPQSYSKAVYKAGEIPDMPPAITLASIKSKLKETGIFNWEDPTLSDRERKEMNKVFEAIEIMMTSRARQPSSVQSVFTSLRLVERVVKKQLKQGQISDTLAARFNWENLRTRVRREDAISSTKSYHLDKNTHMRIFHLST